MPAGWESPDVPTATGEPNWRCGFPEAAPSRCGTVARTLPQGAMNLTETLEERRGRAVAAVEDHLKRLVELGGRDLLLSPGRRPWVRAGGKLRALEGEAAPKDVGELLLKTAPARRREAFRRTGSVCFAAQVDGLGRFRIHVFRECLGSAAVVRLVPGEVVPLEKLGTPEIVSRLCLPRGGLVIVAGPAGSGKTTTLGAMIAQIDRERAVHIVTIEDPMEFVHEPRRCLIHQCEVGIHCESYPEGLRAAPCEGADVILLGGVPDAETAEAALEAATSGCLVLAEMRATTAAVVIQRLLGLFPAGKRACARAALASSLSGVIAQRLLPRADGEGLVAAFEVLVSTPAVATAIRESGARNVESAIRSGARAGMKLLDDALMDLIAAGTLEGHEACRCAASEEDFRKKCAAAGIALDTEESASSAAGASASGPPRPTAASIGRGRLTRAEMFLEPIAAESRARTRSAGRSRTAAFEDSEVPSPDAEPPEDRADPRVIAGRQILVVDDDAGIRDLLVRMLQGAGARVKAIGEPRQALAEIESESYDLAMFDILMPDISGTELYDHAVNMTPTLRERVLFVTGCKLDERLNDRIAARGGRLLRKPFRTDELLRAAAMTLRAERQGP